jgi:hypothetical protein
VINFCTLVSSASTQEMLPESDSDVMVIATSSAHTSFPSTAEDNNRVTKETSSEVSNTYLISDGSEKFFLT